MSLPLDSSDWPSVDGSTFYSFAVPDTDTSSSPAAVTSIRSRSWRLVAGCLVAALALVAASVGATLFFARDVGAVQAYGEDGLSEGVGTAQEARRIACDGGGCSTGDFREFSSPGELQIALADVQCTEFLANRGVRQIAGDTWLVATRDQSRAAQLLDLGGALLC